MAPATDPSNNSNNNDNTSSSSTTQDGNDLPSSASVGDNLAQALKDLARGEQTATALEASLANLESKLDELLASFGIPPEYDEGNNLPEEDDDDDEQDENGDNKDKATVNHGKEGEATEKRN